MAISILEGLFSRRSTASALEQPDAKFSSVVLIIRLPKPAALPRSARRIAVRAQ
jgi:hypothetical protein